MQGPERTPHVQTVLLLGERNIGILPEPSLTPSPPFLHFLAAPEQWHPPSGHAAAGTGCSRRPSLVLRGCPRIHVAEETERPEPPKAALHPGGLRRLPSALVGVPVKCVLHVSIGKRSSFSSWSNRARKLRTDSSRTLLKFGSEMPEMTILDLISKI